MRAIDDENFPDYTYCPINQSHKHRKDAKIQFVALIVSKPKVSADKRLQWRVVDRTGEVSTSALNSNSVMLPAVGKVGLLIRLCELGKFLLPVAWCRL
jgi:hypothetical protein